MTPGQAAKKPSPILAPGAQTMLGVSVGLSRDRYGDAAYRKVGLSRGESADLMKSVLKKFRTVSCEGLNSFPLLDALAS